MKRNVIKALVILGAAFFTFIAQASAASACIMGYYQPEVPTSLKEE